MARKGVRPLFLRSLIVGPRQAGKTTMMEELRAYLTAEGKKTLFLSMDIEDHRQFFVSQSALLQRMKIEFGQERGYVFLDEIQRKDDAGLFLKGLYDMHLPYKMVVCGSGSVELKEKIHESLMGRKRLFELSTVSFREFAHFRTGYRYADILEEFFAVDTAEAERLLDEYVSFGGYPRVILEATREGKRHMMNEIYRSYIEKDIAYLLRVERVAPYFRNVSKEITKSPVVYFHDLGLRNFALGVFGAQRGVYDAGGFLF